MVVPTSLIQNARRNRGTATPCDTSNYKHGGIIGSCSRNSGWGAARSSSNRLLLPHTSTLLGYGRQRSTIIIIITLTGGMVMWL